jgi:hypothetical protein
MEKKKAKKKLVKKEVLRMIVAVQTVAGEILIFEFPSAASARDFADEVESNGCRVLIGWGE